MHANHVVAPALTTRAGHRMDPSSDPFVVAYNLDREPTEHHDVAPTVGTSLRQIGVFDRQQITSAENRSTVRYDTSPTIAATSRMCAITSPSSIRRLMPIELERCQGLPDDYTLIPGASDSARTYVIGNAMAVPVMRWLGERIEMVDALEDAGVPPFQAAGAVRPAPLPPMRQLELVREPRVVVWFSCGLASAATAKLCLDRYGPARTHIVYCDPGSEHPDNKRFLADCEVWLGKKIEVLRSDRYRDIYDVFEKTRWLVGPHGARCTVELKKVLRHAYQEVDDIQAFGYHAGEAARAATFRKNNPEICLITPLIDAGMTKKDCRDLVVVKAGIEEPVMYRLGYRNNNCIGCVKGGMGYWNKIRVDFPGVFRRTAQIERELGVAVCYKEKRERLDGELVRTRLPVFLDELDPKAGRYPKEPDISCGLSCGEQG